MTNKCSECKHNTMIIDCFECFRKEECKCTIRFRNLKEMDKYIGDDTE